MKVPTTHLLLFLSAVGSSSAADSIQPLMPTHAEVPAVRTVLRESPRVCAAAKSDQYATPGEFLVAKLLGK